MKPITFLFGVRSIAFPSKHTYIDPTLDIVMGNFDVRLMLDQPLKFIEFRLVCNMNPTMLGQRCINYCISVGMQHESVNVGPTFSQPSTLRRYPT